MNSPSSISEISISKGPSQWGLGPRRSPALARRQRERGLKVVNGDAQRKDGSVAWRVSQYMVIMWLTYGGFLKWGYP